MTDALAETQQINIDHTTFTEPQMAFWLDSTKYRAFVAGIGSGKTHLGVLECWRQPAGSLGMVCAPTYPQLRDSTLRPFLNLSREAGILGDWRATDKQATLVNGTQILFRSTDDPESLRGPNLYFFWLDEAALMSEEVWRIMIGRRASVGFVTTTPKGLDWVYERFAENDSPSYSVHKAHTKTNVYNPPGWLDEVTDAYDGDYAAQELGGEFVDVGDVATFPYRDLERAEKRELPKSGDIIAGLDVAGPGKDETSLCVRQGQQILEPVSGWADPEQAISAVIEKCRDRKVTAVNVDEIGVGWNLLPRLREALPGVKVNGVNVGTKARNPERFSNLKAEIYWQFRERLAAGEIGGLDRVTLKQLAGIRHHHPSGKTAIVSKKKGGKSPDRGEACILAFIRPGPAARAGMVRQMPGRIKGAW